MTRPTWKSHAIELKSETDNTVECYTQLKAATINGSLHVWWLWYSNWWLRRQERDSCWPPQCSAQHRTRTRMQCTTPDSNRNAVHNTGLEPECSAQHRTRTGMQCTTPDSNRNAVHNTGLEPECSAQHRTRTGMQCTTPDSNRDAVHNTGLEPECSAQHRTRTGMQCTTPESNRNAVHNTRLKPEWMRLQHHTHSATELTTGHINLKTSPGRYSPRLLAQQHVTDIGSISWNEMANENPTIVQKAEIQSKISFDGIKYGDTFE